MFTLFKRPPKPRQAQLLSVIDPKKPCRVGLLQVERGRFRTNDRLSVLNIGRSGSVEIMKVFVNGRESAGTLVVRNGTFEKDQTLVVQEIQTIGL